jgi:hypothetical protein
VFRVKDGGDAPRMAATTVAKPAVKPVAAKPAKSAPAARKAPARADAQRRPAVATRPAAAADHAPALALEAAGDDNWQTF